MDHQSTQEDVAAKEGGILSSAKPYERPRLTRVGSLRHLLGKSGAMSDGASDQMMD
jgi:hypothetical protein